MLILGDENAAARIALEHRDLPIAPWNLDVERTLLEQMPDRSEENRSVSPMQPQDCVQRAIKEITEFARLQIPAHRRSISREFPPHLPVNREAGDAADVGSITWSGARDLNPGPHGPEL